MPCLNVDLDEVRFSIQYSALSSLTCLQLNSFFSDPNLLTQLSDDGLYLNLTDKQLGKVAYNMGGEEGERHVMGLKYKTLLTVDTTSIR
jgi:hypothetical protein